MKKKIIFPIISIILLSGIIASWVKHLTKIQDFDIFGDVDRDEEEF